MNYFLYDVDCCYTFDQCVKETERLDDYCLHLYYQIGDIYKYCDFIRFTGTYCVDKELFLCHMDDINYFDDAQIDFFHQYSLRTMNSQFTICRIMGDIQYNGGGADVVIFTKSDIFAQNYGDLLMNSQPPLKEELTEEEILDLFD